MKGIIVLDIDGTITAEYHAVEQEVVDYLDVLVREGWRIVFITGRPFSWSYRALKAFPFPYHLAAQNGAVLLEMPARKVVKRKYLNRKIFPVMEKICKGEPTDFVVYGSFEKEVCYFRSACFSPGLLHYVMQRKKTLFEEWIDVSSFDALDLQEFPSVKCFGEETSLRRIAQKIEHLLGLHVPLVRDPFCDGYFVAQATHSEVSKGNALRDFVSLLGDPKTVIAAGDDNNDKSMLEVADVRIVMATAPEEILKMADIVAPSAADKGIVTGLKMALNGPMQQNRRSKFFTTENTEAQRI